MTESSAFRVLASIDVRRWVASRILSGLGTSMLRATVLWHVYDVSESTAVLGLVGLLSFVPSPFASLAGGVTADRADRKRIVMSTGSVTALLCGALFALALARSLSLPTMVLLFVLSGASVAFESPARQSILPALVPREELGKAITVMSTAGAFAFVSGPPIAGVLIGRGGLPLALAASMMASAFAVLCAGLVAVPPAPKAAQTLGRLESLRSGFRYVLADRVLLASLSIDLLAVVFGGATAMLPVFARDIWRVGPDGYGLLAAGLDLGAVLMSLVLLVSPPIDRLGRSIVVSVAVYGAATIAFGLARTLPEALLAYFVVGMADQVSVVARSTLVQWRTDDAFRGRVSSVNTLFILASNQLSIAESGAVAALTSPEASVIGGGVMVLVVVLITSLSVPELWRMSTRTALSSAS